MQDWWLDVLCGEHWHPIIVFDKESKPESAMVYHWKKKYGFNFILPPPLTPTMGAWFRYPTQPQKRHSRYHHEMKLTDALIDKLPDATLTITQLGLNFDNWLPFMWRGFKQRTRYTFLIENLTDFDAVSANFSENVKRNLKKGKDLIVEESDDVAVLYDLAQGSLEKNGSQLNFSFDTLNLLYLKIKEQNAGQIFQIKNVENEILASALIVWDKEKAYFLVAGDNRKNMSASTVLIHSVLQKMSAKNIQVFDFEGSMIESIANFYRSFGAKPQAYHLIFKAKNKFWAMVFPM
jgi:hypothetical protein